MKTNSLRQVLMKKSKDESLRSFIYHMDDSHLVNYVSESLEKMARTFGHKKPNPLLVSFANSLPLNNKITQMIYDQLSHHATRYKAALKSDNKQLAARHITRIMKTLHMIDKITHDGKTNHTEPTPTMLKKDPNLKTALNNMLSDKAPTDWICPKPWERNAYANKKSVGGHPSQYNTEYYETKTKGVGRDHPDYSYVQGAPHFSYWKEVKGHGHNKGWPLEQTRVNGRYINIDDNHQSSGQYEPHPFDEHPVMSIYDVPSHHLVDDPSISSRYDKAESDWLEKYLVDPAAYKTMVRKNPNVGMQPSAPVHSQENQLDVGFHEKASASGAAPDKGPSIKDVRAQIDQIRGNKPLSEDDIKSKLDEIKRRNSGDVNQPAPSTPQQTSDPSEENYIRSKLDEIKRKYSGAAPTPAPASQQELSGDEARTELNNILKRFGAAPAQAPEPAKDEGGQMSFDLPVEPSQMSMDFDEPGPKRRG